MLKTLVKESLSETIGFLVTLSEPKTPMCCSWTALPPANTTCLKGDSVAAVVVVAEAVLVEAREEVGVVEVLAAVDHPVARLAALQEVVHHLQQREREHEAVP